MICAIGVILPKWTMIYIFHVRTGFLRGWLIVLVWNNSSGNLFQNWLIHTLHGISLGFFFCLSFCLICVLSLFKLSLSLPSQTQFVFTKTLYGEGSVCTYIYKKNTCIHKCIYVCAYTGEKKKLGLLQRPCLFFSKVVNFALSTSFHILVWPKDNNCKHNCFHL